MHEHDEETEMSIARERPGNDTLTERSKRTLLVGVKTVGRGAAAPGVGFHIPAARSACGGACNPSNNAQVRWKWRHIGAVNQGNLTVF